MSDVAADVGLIPEAEYLAFAKIGKRAAANQRSRGEGPPYVRVGKTIYYRRDELRKWIEKRTVRAKRIRTLIDGGITQEATHA